MPFHPTKRPEAAVTEWCVCGATYGSLTSLDAIVRAAWDRVHDQHARNDRYTDEERDG